MDTDTLIAKVKNQIDVELPAHKLNRWAREGFIPRAYAGHKGGGRGADWPPEAVEETIAIYTLRTRELPWGTTIQGDPATGKKEKTVSTAHLLQAKKVVESFYSDVARAKLTGQKEDLPHMAVPMWPGLPIIIKEFDEWWLIMAVREIEVPTPHVDGGHLRIEQSRHPAVFPGFHRAQLHELTPRGSPAWVKRNTETRARECTLALVKDMKKRAATGDADAATWIAKLEEYRHRHSPAVFGHSFLSPIVVTWIATLEKVRCGWPVSTPAEIRVTCNGIGLAPALGDIVTIA